MESIADQLKEIFTDKENTKPLTDDEFERVNRFRNSDHKLDDLEIVIAEEFNYDTLSEVNTPEA
ncbi:MAG: hypothetical protein B6D68_01080 [spirochete symbiont of Stewartia floridana]|nr:MAG: hypothetical protein B6D68_01080 [spirochete symbiont of Stewartia floridana]